MQLLHRINNCNGCAACVVPCKANCVKMHTRDDEAAQQVIAESEGRQPAEGTKPVAVINEGGCGKCNACTLYCPLYNPIDMPVFDTWYEYSEEYANRDLPKLYRATMRQAREGRHTEFVGTLCEIAALISLSGNRVRPNLILKPMVCSEEKRQSEPCCKECIFYK